MDCCSICDLPCLVLVLAVVVSLYLLFGKGNKAKKLDPSLPKGTVLLHMFPRGPKAPNASPFPLKLETFLRVNKIPYQCDFKDFMSSKSKSPWMQFNGEATADSQFCIERLNRELEIDMNAHLSRKEKAIARAFLALLEDCLYWVIFCSRWHRTTDRTLKAMALSAPQTFLLKFLLVPKVKKQGWMQGMARHSREEQWDIFKSIVGSLSDYMGDKPYLMGDKISEVDCSLFGFLVQIMYQDYEDEVHKDHVKTHCSNLVDFTKRMREEFWSDSRDFVDE